MEPIKHVLADRILIPLPEVQEVTDSGIIKSEDAIAEETAAAARKLDEEGGLVAIVAYKGPECKFVEVGDIIELDNPRMPILNIHGKRYGAVNEYNVICVVNPKNTNEAIEA